LSRTQQYSEYHSLFKSSKTVSRSSEVGQSFEIPRKKLFRLYHHQHCLMNWLLKAILSVSERISSCMSELYQIGIMQSGSCGPSRVSRSCQMHRLIPKFLYSTIYHWESGQWKAADRMRYAGLCLSSLDEVKNATIILKFSNISK
jgi:hypothetical protein